MSYVSKGIKYVLYVYTCFETMDVATTLLTRQFIQLCNLQFGKLTFCVIQVQYIINLRISVWTQNHFESVYFD
jgi:hypothetical protein